MPAEDRAGLAAVQSSVGVAVEKYAERCIEADVAYAFEAQIHHVADGRICGVVGCRVRCCGSIGAGIVEVAVLVEHVIEAERVEYG